MKLRVASKIISVITFLVVANARAESLIVDDSCVSENIAIDLIQPPVTDYAWQDSSEQENIADEFSGWKVQTVAASQIRTATANRCEKLKGFKSGFDYVSMSLLPVSIAMRSPAVTLQLAELGLTLANPAVLGVTVLGASGYVVIYFILKKSFEECEALEKEELRESIVKELSSKYKMQSSGRVDLRIQN